MNSDTLSDLLGEPQVNQVTLTSSSDPSGLQLSPFHQPFLLHSPGTRAGQHACSGSRGRRKGRHLYRGRLFIYSCPTRLQKPEQAAAGRHSYSSKEWMAGRQGQGWVISSSAMAMLWLRQEVGEGWTGWCWCSASVQGPGGLGRLRFSWGEFWAGKALEPLPYAWDSVPHTLMTAEEHIQLEE